MEHGGEKKKIMNTEKKYESLSAGVSVDSYEDLIAIEHDVVLFDPTSNEIYTFTHYYSSPGLLNVKTGNRFFGTDIRDMFTFPFHLLCYVPLMKEEMGEPL
jgi:hypothetical protein